MVQMTQTIVHPQEVRYAQKMEVGARLCVGDNEAWLYVDGDKRFVSDRWIRRMESHGFIEGNGVLGEMVLTDAGRKIAELDPKVEAAKRKRAAAQKVIKTAKRREDVAMYTERLSEPVSDEEMDDFLKVCGPEACADQKRGYHGSSDGACSGADDLICRLIYQIRETGK